MKKNEKKKLGIMNSVNCHKYNIGQFTGKSVVVYGDKLQYFEKHKDDYKNEESYHKTMESLEKIINYPDYIYYDSSKRGLEFYAFIEEDICVAVRADVSARELKVKSLYPVKKSKIKNRANKSGIPLD